MLTSLISFFDFRNMGRTSHILAIVFSTLLAGCALNSVKPLPNGAMVKDGRAIIVYGVRVEDNLDWAFQKFGVQLDEYNTRTHTAGDCLQFNKTEAIVSSIPGATTYFAFDVSPGTYVYSIFNGAPLTYDFQSNAQAFLAPVNRIVYVGDFVLRHRKTEIRHDFDAFKKALGKSLPDLKGEIFLAETILVEQSKPFLCAP
jgi:hypothetical protein